MNLAWLLGRISVSCRWCWSRCDKPVGAERTEWAAQDGPLRRSTRRYSPQRDEFYPQCRSRVCNKLGGVLRKALVGFNSSILILNFD